MAISRDTFVIFPEQYFSGMTEVLMQQAVDMSGSGGVFVMENRNLQGEVEQASFFESIGSNLVEDRDPTDMTNATFNDLTMSETVGIKIHRRMKVEKAVNAFKAIAGGGDMSIMSYVLGQQQGKAMALDYLNNGIGAAKASLQAIGADVTYDAVADATDTTLTPSGLVELKAKLGDASGNIRAWVMHSRMAHDLLGDAVASSVSTVAGPGIFEASFGTLNVPVIITDSPNLVDLDPAGDGSQPAQYFVLGLTEGAVRLTESEEREVLTRMDDTRANITARVTTEAAYTVGTRGCSWQGGNYPQAADLADAANWSFAYSDVKSALGVLGVFNARGDV